MKSKVKLTEVPYGTYKDIASALGYTPAYVSMVAHRKRSNIHVEEALIKAAIQLRRKRNSLSKLRQQLIK